MRMLAMPGSNSFARQINRLQREFENAFASSESVSYPALNLWEDDDAFHVETELPGYDQANLEAYIVGNDQLVLKGERKPVQLDKAVAHRSERTFGSFERTLTLPVPVDGDKVQAKYTNGVLHLTLAKSAIAKPRKIDIAIN